MNTWLDVVLPTAFSVCAHKSVKRLPSQHCYSTRDGVPRHMAGSRFADLSRIRSASISYPKRPDAKAHGQIAYCHASDPTQVSKLPACRARATKHISRDPRALCFSFKL